MQWWFCNASLWCQARRQDSVTERAVINFGGAREVYLGEFERGTGAREIYLSLDQMNKVKTKDSKGFSGQNREFKRFFRSKTGDLQKKKRFSFQKCHEVRCQSTKSTKIIVANTNFGLDLHSSSPEPVNFFGAQSSLGGDNFRLGGHKQSFGGARPRYAPPWSRVCLVSSNIIRMDGEHFEWFLTYISLLPNGSDCVLAWTIKIQCE